jgi:hypothetical protein
MQITFLGDATDAGDAPGGAAKEMEEDSKPAAVASRPQTHRPDYSDLHAQVSAAEASTIRQPRVMSGKDLRLCL